MGFALPPDHVPVSSWTDGDGFAPEDKPEFNEEMLAAQIVEFVGANAEQLGT